MGNLSALQKGWLAQGQPVRQVFSMMVPENSSALAFTTTVFDSGIFKSAVDGLRCVTNPGSRTFEVWNPSPQKDVKPKAIRWAFDVDNRDKEWFEGAGGHFRNPVTTYDAKPQQCFIKHELYIWTSATWNNISHMTFIGRIINIAYEDGVDATGTIVPVAATVTTEQEGAWQILRRPFQRDDAQHQVMTVSGSPQYLTIT